MIATSHHKLILACKRFLYRRHGEPYRIGGHTLRYEPGTRPVRTHYINSTNIVTRYDALQVQLLSKSLAEGDSAIDIGAHCGQYTILMAALCGQSGRVVAFEPDPYACKLLLKNLNLNPHIKKPVVETYAVSD